MHQNALKKETNKKLLKTTTKRKEKTI